MGPTHCKGQLPPPPRPAPRRAAAAAPPPDSHCRAAGLRLESPPASPGPTQGGALAGHGVSAASAPHPHPQLSPGRQTPTAALQGLHPARGQSGPRPHPRPAPLRELISCWMARDGSMSTAGLRAALQPPLRVQPRTALPRPGKGRSLREESGGAGRSLPARGGASADRCSGTAARAHAPGCAPPPPLRPLPPGRMTAPTPAVLSDHPAASRHFRLAHPPHHNPVRWPSSVPSGPLVHVLSLTSKPRPVPAGDTHPAGASRWRSHPAPWAQREGGSHPDSGWGRASPASRPRPLGQRPHPRHSHLGGSAPPFTLSPPLAPSFTHRFLGATVPLPMTPDALHTLLPR